jgi:hypothetical protein
MGHRRQGQDTGMSWPCLGVGRTSFETIIAPLLRTCCTAGGRTGVVCPSLCLPQATGLRSLSHRWSQSSAAGNCFENEALH